MPLVSVLLPARSAAPTLDAALASVLRAPFGDLELVAVDDGSTDDTPLILARWAARDRRVHVVRGAGTGLVDALNLGLGHCAGALVARMDADDVSHPKRLALQSAALAADASLAGVGAFVRCFPRASVQGGMRAYEAWQNSLVTAADVRRERFVEAPLVHPSVTLRRSALESVGGYRDAGWPEDYDLWLRLFERGHSLAKVPRVLLWWRESASRLTRVDPRYSPAAHWRLKAHFLTRGPLNERSFSIAGAGPSGRALARSLAREGRTPARFFDVDPKKLGRRFEGAEVFPVDTLGAPGEELVLSAVGSPGGRAEVRAFLGARGHVEGTDWLAVT